MLFTKQLFVVLVSFLFDSVFNGTLNFLLKCSMTMQIWINRYSVGSASDCVRKRSNRSCRVEPDLHSHGGNFESIISF